MKILGYTYKLKLKPTKKLQNRGYFEGESQTISIGSDMNRQAQEATVLHEVIHALDFMLAIDLSEEQVRQLEHGLYQVLTDNGVSLAPLLKGAKE
jgi:hypothetical protein